jgi:hypothetical protein
MEEQSRLDVASEAKKIGDVVLAEQIYHDILSKSAGNNESALREQESALIQLGEVYRDQKCDHSTMIWMLMIQTSRQTRRTYKDLQNYHVKLCQSQNCKSW